jgi:hypothetical protein
VSNVNTKKGHGTSTPRGGSAILDMVMWVCHDNGTVQHSTTYRLGSQRHWHRRCTLGCTQGFCHSPGSNFDLCCWLLHHPDSAPGQTDKPALVCRDAILGNFLLLVWTALFDGKTCPDVLGSRLENLSCTAGDIDSSVLLGQEKTSRHPVI